VFMKLSEFDYHLPAELIAQYPAAKRGESRLLVVNRTTGKLEHRQFPDLLEYFGEDDVLVLNQTRVLRARLPLSEGKEIFLVEPKSPPLKEDLGGSNETIATPPSPLQRGAQVVWKCLVRKGKKFQVGDEHILPDNSRAKVCEVLADGTRIIEFSPKTTLNQMLKSCGEMPLPPYLQRKADKEDETRYQTVYAQDNVAGSVAAPTAGLHFTDELLQQLQSQGVTVVKVQLNVGLGTFAPVKVENIEEHQMHAEWCEISAEAAAQINNAKQSGKKITAVGSTSLRTLESFAQADGTVQSGQKQTDIFIYPPYTFQVVDHLLTNFHLPKSTLLMMMAAFAEHNGERSDGVDFVQKVYDAAVKEEYKFFSYGDASLWL
jgi:S-adenosylmethionine:tRNA ribosyltransferase-isomerase